MSSCHDKDRQVMMLLVNVKMS